MRRVLFTADARCDRCVLSVATMSEILRLIDRCNRTDFTAAGTSTQLTMLVMVLLRHWLVCADVRMVQ